MVASLLVIPTLAALAPGGEEPTDKTLSPYFIIENGDPAVDSLPLKGTKVKRGHC